MRVVRTVAILLLLGYALVLTWTPLQERDRVSPGPAPRTVGDSAAPVTHDPAPGVDAPATDHQGQPDPQPPARDESATRPEPPALFDRSVPLAPPRSNSTGPNLLERVSVVATRFKYPYLRVEEHLSVDPTSGAEQVLSRHEMVADHILVRLRDNVDADTLRRLARRHGAKVRRRLPLTGIYIVELGAPTAEAVPDALAAFRAEAAEVAYAEPDYIVHATETLPNDPRFPELYGLHNTGQDGGVAGADIRAAAAWDQVTGGTVVVGVVDTGVDYNHEDLSDNMWRNPGEIAGDAIDNDGNGFVDDIHGWDFLNEDSDPMDDNSHGTHVAGTIAAVGNNGLGVAGVNWHAKLMALKFLSAGGSGPTSDAAEALAYANMMRRDHGVDVRLTSNSWGSDSPSQVVADQIEASRVLDMLFIAAAGNSARDTDVLPHYPSCQTNENLISVASTDRSDNRSGFSNYGAVSVDLGAPGSSILSTIPGGSYGLKSGTSMATPHVAGVAALVWNASPNETWENVRDAILSGVDLIPSMQAITVSGGRLNAANAIENLGMRVRSSSPGPRDTVGAAPTDFTVAFTFPFDPATLDAADLTVNTVAASTVSTVDSSTVVFHFPVSPVTAQGNQEINMAAGAVNSLADGDPVAAYVVFFRYDLLPMEVVSSIPADDATVTLPFTNFVVTLNEAVVPSTVDVSDLLPSAGSVVEARVINPTTIEYVLTDIVDEGHITLRLLEGALEDAYGNPGHTYAINLLLDAETSAYPAATVRRAPPGSVVHETEAGAYIGPPGDTDAYTIAVDAGQTLSVLVLPDETLQPEVTVRDPATAVAGQNTAAAPGSPAVVQTVAIPAAGTYEIEVTGAGGSTGNYTTRLFLNAGLEEEAYLGGANDDPASAQSLQASFIVPGPAGAERAAVLGKLATAVYTTNITEGFEAGVLGPAWTSYSEDGGRVLVSDQEPASEGSYALLMDRSPDGPFTLNEADWSVDLSGRGGARLRFYHTTWSDQTQEFFGDFEGHAQADGVAISDDGIIWHPVWNGTGENLSGTWKAFEVDLGAEAAEAGMTLGPDFRIRFQQYDNMARPNDGRGWDRIAVLTPEESADWYRVDLEAGDSVEVAVAGRDGAASVSLHDAAGVLLMQGVGPAPDLDSVIRHYAATTAGAYYARVAGTADIDYTLVVTRNAAFDEEPNNSIGAAMAIPGHGVVLGAIHSPPTLYAVDWLFPPPAHILQLDPDTLKVRRRFNAPYITADQPYRHNLASDGTNLWYSGSANTNGTVTLYHLDGESGDVLDSFDAPIPIPNGLAWLDGELFAADGTGTVHVLDVATQVKTRTLSPTIQGYFRGLEGDSKRGVLWASSLWQRIYEIDPVTGVATERRNYSGERTGHEQGLALVSDEIFVSEGSENQIAVYDAQTFASLRRSAIDVFSHLGGLGGNNSGTTEDWFTFQAAAGDALTIRTHTPAGDATMPLAPANSLDPVLELYAPGGALLAGDDNGAGDGVNAQLNHTTAESGLFKIRIQGAGNSRGEYVLEVLGATGVIDVAPPSIICPADADLDAGPACSVSLPDYTDSAIVTDDLSPPEAIVVTQDPAPGTDLSEVGPLVVTLQAMDEQGKTAECSFTVNVSLDAGLVITAPPDVTVTCGSDTSPAGTGTATASDACAAAPSVSYEDTPGSCSIHRMWTATNAVGNSAQALQTITLDDTTPPTISAPANLTVECGSDTGPDGAGYPTASDACHGVPTLTYVDDVQPTGCPDQYTITRTWTATDLCGNSSQDQQVVSVYDTLPPVVTIPPDITIQCTESTKPNHTGQPTVTDNCDASPSISYSQSVAPGPCQGSSVLVRTWQATDNCGNTGRGEQVITVIDTQAPEVVTPPDLTVDIDADMSPPVTGFAAGTDDCGGAPAVTYEDAGVPGTNGMAWVVTRTWSATDACGNTTNRDQTIYINGESDNVVTALQYSAGYDPPAATVMCEVHYPGDRTLLSLLWTPDLPAGWSLDGATGNGGPEVLGNTILFNGSLVSNPVVFAYTVVVPGTESGAKAVGGAVEYHLNGMFNPAAIDPDPAALPLHRLYDLEVTSVRGNTDPPVGVHAFEENTDLTLAVTNSPVPGAPGQQFAATGWSGSGSVPASGSGTSTGITLTEDSAIDWLWKTQYLLTVSAANGGGVAEPGGWHDADTLTPLNPAPVSGFTFSHWSGDVPSGMENDDPLNLLMDQARDVTAHFDLDAGLVRAADTADTFRSPSTNLVVGGQFDYPAGQQVVSLSWTPTLPPGWSLAHAYGDGNPSVNGDTLEFAGPYSNNPVAFEYVVNVPGNEPIAADIAGGARFRLNGMSADWSLDTTPPTRPLLRVHSADYRVPWWSVDATEANRALAYWRDGGYYPEPEGFDGYAPTNAPLSGQTNLGLHSADYEAPPWVLSGTEVSRVLAYWRVGAYHADPAGADGYAPGSGSGGSGGAGEFPVFRQAGGAGYNPGGVFAVTNTITYSNQVVSLLWRPNLPEGWSVDAVSGDGAPEYKHGEILWTAGALPASPIEMTYTVSAPLWESAPRSIESTVEYWLADEANHRATSAQPFAMVLPARDSDGDGMPDGWEEYYGGGPTNLSPRDDLDGDHLDNLSENVAGTDPGDSNSVLETVFGALPDGSGALLRWASVTHRVYSISRSTNLLEGFEPAFTNLPATPPVNEQVDPEAGPNSFYHLGVEVR